jgi:hypothetical protein
VVDKFFTLAGVSDFSEKLGIDIRDNVNPLQSHSASGPVQISNLPHSENARCSVPCRARNRDYTRIAVISRKLSCGSERRLAACDEIRRGERFARRQRMATRPTLVSRVEGTIERGGNLGASGTARLRWPG